LFLFFGGTGGDGGNYPGRKDEDIKWVKQEV
jgi:hypothetical protein